MPTRHRRSPERGGLVVTASALGLALLVGGGVAALRVDDGGSSSADAATPPVPSYAVERVVGLSGAEDPPVRPRAHPARGRPTRIVVPRLGVDAPVVGIDAPGGVLLPPDDPRVLGWWRSGARPGSRFGSALVTGHTVSSGGGAFDDLETLRGGDRVVIRTARGRIGYAVRSVTIYRKASLARHAARVFSQRVPGRLVLITCEDWNGSVYLSNAVVVAKPVT